MFQNGLKSQRKRKNKNLWNVLIDAFVSTQSTEEIHGTARCGGIIDTQGNKSTKITDLADGILKLKTEQNLHNTTEIAK